MKKKISTVILGGALILGIGTHSFASTENDSKTKVNNDLFEYEMVENGKVKMKVHKELESKEIEADLMLLPEDISSKELMKYKKKMPQYYYKLKKDLVEVSPVTVTLNRTISIEDFDSLVANNEVKAHRIFARTTTKDGMEGGVTLALENGKIPTDKLESILEGPDELKFVGIYAFEGEVSVQNKTFENLSSEEDVFLVDVTHNFIKEKVEKSKEFKNLNSKHHVDVNVFDLYWELELSKDLE